MLSGIPDLCPLDARRAPSPSGDDKVGLLSRPMSSVGQITLVDG